MIFTGAPAGVVFFVRYAEEENSGDFERDNFVDDFRQAIEGPLELARHGTDFTLEIGSMIDEEGIDKVVRAEVVFTDHIAKPGQGSETSHPDLGKCWLIHGNVRGLRGVGFH